MTIAESKRQNLPPDHPDVVDAVQRRSGNRGWFVSARGPSDSAAYRVSYFGESESDIEARKLDAKGAYAGKPRDKTEHVLAERLDAASKHLADLQEARAINPQAVDDATIRTARKAVQKAETDYVNYTPDVASASTAPTRRDLRGTMPGHWDPLYHKDTGYGASPDSWRLAGKGGSIAHRKWREWEDWEGPPAKDEAPPEPPPGSLVPPPPSAPVAPGAPVPASPEDYPDSWHRGRADDTEADDTESPFPKESSGPMTGAALYEDMTPAPEGESVTDYRGGQTFPVPDEPGVPGRPGYDPTGGVTDDPTQPLPEGVEPYQPIVGEGGQRALERVSETQLASDRKFDNMFGRELWRLRDRMDSKNFQPQLGWWDELMQGVGLSKSQHVGSMWFDTFMKEARKIVGGGRDLSGEDRAIIDREIMRWGDRHISTYSRGHRDGTIKGSTYWTTESPTLKRKRKPAISGGRPWWSIESIGAQTPEPPPWLPQWPEGANRTTAKLWHALEGNDGS